MKKYFISATVVVAAVAANLPNSSTILRQVQPLKELHVEEKPLVEVGGVEKYTPIMQDDTNGKKIFVKAFKLTHVMNVSETQLQEALKPYIGKELSFSELQEAASVITKFYRSKGYFVARAYIPKQKIENNIVEIAVIEGYYGKFKIDNNSSVNDEVIQNIFNELNKQEDNKNIISGKSLERSMLIVNDLAGVRVSSVDASPGTVVGHSDFAVKTEKTPWYDGYIIGDNYGSRYTGKNRLMAGVNLNSLAGLGDKLGLSGLISSDSNLQNARVSYSVPLLPNGLTSEVSYSMTSYKLANNKEIEDLKLDGKSSTFDASLSYPIIKQRGETFTISSILSSKRLQDFQESNIKKDKKITSLGITLAYTKDKNIFGLNSQISSALTLTSGELAFVDSDSKEIDKDAARLAGNYNKISGYTNLAFKLNQNYTLNTNVTFQHSLGNKNLDGTEDFSIGGSNGVKVYPDGEFACENGIMFNTELFRTLPSFYGISNKVGVFYDIARGSFQNSSYDDTLKSRTLQDGGLSYYVNYKNVFAKAQFSKTIGSEKVQTEYIGDSSRFLLQAGASF